MKEKEKKKKKKVKLIIALAIALVVMIGGTYAWLTLTKQGTKVNVIKAGTFELTLDDEASEGILITGEAAQPIPTSEGVTLDGYDFTVKNTGDLKADYTLYLDDVTSVGDEEITNRMADKYVRYSLNYTENNETALLTTIGSNPNRILYQGTLESGASKTFNLKLWIDQDADNNVLGTTFAGQIRLEAEQARKTTAVSFESDSWDVIATAVKSGTYPYSVGDTKTVDMGELGTHTVRVANTSECTNGETSETACGFVVEFAGIITTYAMHSGYTNVGGWPASEMRSYVNSTIYSALPSDLQNVIADTTVVSSHGSTSGEGNFTSTDKLYLLSTKEVWGKEETSNAITYDTAESETRQLDYYKNNGVTTSNYRGAIKQNNGSNKAWWLRSATSIYTNSFFIVNYIGGWNSTDADSTGGVSPAFRIA